MWNLVLVCLETELASVQERCMACIKHTIGSEIIFDTPDGEHLGDEGHVESCFGLFGDGVSVGVRQVHGLHQTYNRVKNHFGAQKSF
jgi:hypothetical protein